MVFIKIWYFVQFFDNFETQKKFDEKTETGNILCLFGKDTSLLRILQNAVDFKNAWVSNKALRHSASWHSA